MKSSPLALVLLGAIAGCGGEASSDLSGAGGGGDGGSATTAMGGSQGGSAGGAGATAGTGTMAGASGSAGTAGSGGAAGLDGAAGSGAGDAAKDAQADSLRVDGAGPDGASLDGSRPDAGSGGAGGSGGGEAGASDAAPDTVANDASLDARDSGSAGGSMGDASCGIIAVEGVPLDVFVMQDKSGSMECPAADDTCANPPLPTIPSTRWDAVSAAINTFVSSPRAAGVGIGIGFFGLMDGTTPCSAGAYTTPVVPIAALPGNATAVSNAVAATMPGGGTPTTPALQGAIDYAKAYTVAQRGERSAAVLFITDGLPTGCGTTNTVATAVQVAKAGYDGAPRITTFVVGMGDTAALDQVALAGSGNSYHYVPTMGDVVGTVTAALQAITGMITCQYALRVPPGSAFDPALVSVEVSVGGGGMPATLGKVSDATSCGAPGGWYYDDNANPSLITLCPQTCDPLRATPTSQVQVLVGCASIPPRR